MGWGPYGGRPGIVGDELEFVRLRFWYSGERKKTRPISTGINLTSISRFRERIQIPVDPAVDSPSLRVTAQNGIVKVDNQIACALC